MFNWIKKYLKTNELASVITNASFLLNVKTVWKGERVMYDTEYIEYLEKENQELKDKFDKLNNQYQQEHVNELFDLKKQYETKLKQFLKVVESVLKEHWLTNNEVNCSCKEIYNTQHLLQEIKSAMEKGNNNG